MRILASAAEARQTDKHGRSNRRNQRPHASLVPKLPQPPRARPCIAPRAPCHWAANEATGCFAASAVRASTGAPGRRHERRRKARRSPRLMVDHRPALLGRGGAGVADRALGIQVLRLPAELAEAVGAEVLELAMKSSCAERKSLGEVHLHEIGPQMEHDRRLDVAAVDAVERLLGRRDALRLTETRPRGATTSMSWRTRSSRATMSTIGTLPPCELTMISLSTPARCTLSPISSQSLVVVSHVDVSVPGRRDVLVRLADRLHRQERHRQVGRQQFDSRGGPCLRRCRCRCRPAGAAHAARSPPPATPRSSPMYRCRRNRAWSFRASGGGEAWWLVRSRLSGTN